jgi:hypothetical protein
MRRGLYALTAVTAFAIATWCGLSVYQIVDTGLDINNAKKQTADLQVRYQQATRQFPAAPTTADNLQRAVEISQRIGATTRTPELSMALLSEALEQNPAIYLKNFGWKYDRTEFSSESSGIKPPSAATAAPVAAGASARKQSMAIEGEVRPFRGDYRAAIDSINRFVAALSQRPEVAEVRIAKLPLDINPSLSLSGNTLENREQVGRAEFKLVIVLKPTV